MKTRNISSLIRKLFSKFAFISCTLFDVNCSERNEKNNARRKKWKTRLTMMTIEGARPHKAERRKSLKFKDFTMGGNVQIFFALAVVVRAFILDDSIADAAV